MRSTYCYGCSGAAKCWPSCLPFSFRLIAPLIQGPSSALRRECMAQGRRDYPAEEADAGIGVANKQIPGWEWCLATPSCIQRQPVLHSTSYTFGFSYSGITCNNLDLSFHIDIFWVTPHIDGMSMRSTPNNHGRKKREKKKKERKKGRGGKRKGPGARNISRKTTWESPRRTKTWPVWMTWLTSSCPVDPSPS